MTSQESNNMQNIEEKNKNKTHSIPVNIDEKTYKEIYSNEPKVYQENQYIEVASPVIENYDINATIVPKEGIPNIPMNQIKEESAKITASTLSVSALSKVEYKSFPKAKQSNKQLGNIIAFGCNSYNGKVKSYNEDRIRVVPSTYIQSKKNPDIKYHVSYFSIFDGHGGKNCSDFLKKNLYEYLISSPFFPDEPMKAIQESFKKAESQFYQMAVDPKNKVILDKSGSCALIMLIIDNILYAINLGDSRALYSYNTGKCLLQITRDHKPNDEIEKKRIEKVGGSIYYANKVIRNGKEITLKEEDYGKDFTFPYRVSPGGLAVNNNYYIILIF